MIRPHDGLGHSDSSIESDSAFSLQGLLDFFRQRFVIAGLVLQLRRLTGQCALEPGVLVSAPKPADLLSRPLGKVSEKAQEFARAVAGQRTDYESHYRDNRKRAIAVSWEIAHLIDGQDDRIAYEFARSCLRANRTKTGTNILRSLASKEGNATKYIASARQRIARQAWKAGDLEQALLAMRSLRGRAAKSQYRTWLGIATVRNGLLIAERGNVDGARSVLIGGLIASGMDQPFALAVAEIYLNAVRKTPVDSVLESLAPSIHADGARSEPHPIILAGFGWSGSGAIADFLRGHPDVVDVFSSREMGLWTGKYGLDRLYNHFASRGFNRRLLLEFLTRHCFGHRFLGHSKGTKSLGGMWAWLDESRRWALLDALAQWLDAIRQWEKQADYPLLEAFQSLSSTFLRLIDDNGAAHILLSNCIPSDAIVGIRMFREPAVIVSWRNPGDAYASKKAAFPDNTLDFSGWRGQLTSRIDNYLGGKAEVTNFAKLWLDVSFEDFVQDERERQHLLELLNLDGVSMDSTFDPSESSRNIGIHGPQAGTNNAGWSDLADFVDESRRKAIALSRRSASSPQET